MRQPLKRVCVATNKTGSLMFTEDVERNQINSEQQIHTLTFTVIQILQKKKKGHGGVSHTDMGTKHSGKKQSKGMEYS